MEPSSSTTYSEEQVTQAIEDLKWTTGIILALADRSGGKITLSRKDLDDIDLSMSNLRVSYDKGSEMYLIERVNREL